MAVIEQFQNCIRKIYYLYVKRWAQSPHSMHAKCEPYFDCSHISRSDETFAISRSCDAAKRLPCARRSPLIGFIVISTIAFAGQRLIFMPGLTHFDESPFRFAIVLQFTPNMNIEHEHRTHICWTRL